MQKFPLVLVEWEDITDFDGWSSMTEEFVIARCYSVGWLIHRDKKCIRITESTQPENPREAFGMVKSIPMGCVKEIRRLKVSS